MASDPTVEPPHVSVEKGLEKASTPTDGQSLKESIEKDLEKQTSNVTDQVSEPNKADDEPEYPPFREVLIIVLGLYLTMFLLALVSPPHHRTEKSSGFDWADLSKV